jgi:hypothetical protein
MSQNDSVIHRDALPTKQDFVPENDDEDAQYAWKNFGGLTLTEAAQKFREAPDVYQEDFMWMGGKAFAFYFPVLENFLSETPVDAGDDREAWILAHAIKMQFETESLPDVVHLAPRVLSLADFVLANLHRLDPDPRPGYEVGPAWHGLRSLVESVQASKP